VNAGPIRVVTVDDEPLARLGLRRAIERDADFRLVKECAHGLEAVDAVRSLRPDLLVLDLQLPGLDGFGVVEAVGADHMPALIFATAFDEHALRAFDAQALDYVLKPFDGDRLQKALDRAKALVRLRQLDRLGESLRAALAAAQHPGGIERIVVKSAGRISFASVDEIDWIEAADNYVQLHVGRATHLVLGTLAKLEASLSAEKFLRVHRSAIVNVTRIRTIEPLFHGEYRIVLESGDEVTSGRTYRERLERLVSNAF
jgi:two-component system, LytTR family, response regulator